MPILTFQASKREKKYRAQLIKHLTGVKTGIEGFHAIKFF